MFSRIMNFVPTFLRAPLYHFPVLILLSALSGLLYLNVLQNGQFLFDDYDYIVNNPALHSLDSFRNFTDPRYIGYLSFYLNVALSGMEPFSFHLVNVGIHAVNAFLVYLLVSLIISCSRFPGEELPAWWVGALPLLTALLFLCHPLATQSVSYVTQRFNSLCSLFYLLSIVSYLYGRHLFERKPHAYAAYAPYIASLLFAVLSMKTKEIAFTIPFTLLMLELLLFGGSFFRWRRLVFLIPFVLTLCIIPLSLYGPRWGLLDPGTEGVAEITRLDKIYDLEYRSRYEYFITQSRVIMTYLRLLIFPWPLRVIYEYVPSVTFWSPAVIISFMTIGLLNLTGFACWAIAGLYSGRNSLEMRLGAIGIFWFFITISIESSLIPIKDLIFEHRTYLPSVGFMLAASLLLIRLAESFANSIAVRKRVVCLMVLLVLLLGSATYARNSIWISELTLWQDVVEKAPNKAIGYHNRGLAYSKQGYLEQALQDLNIAISYFSRDPSLGMRWESADLSPFNMAKAYTNRANIHMAIGNMDAAAEDNRRAQELFSRPTTSPEQFPVDDRLKLADSYAGRGESEKALAELNRLLAVEKDNPAFLINRGNAFSALRKFDEALEDMNRAVGIRPDMAVIYHNRALVYVGMERDTQAMNDLQKACSMGFRPSCEALDFVRGNGGKFPGR